MDFPVRPNPVDKLFNGIARDVDDPASRVYVNNKKKACADLGMLSEEYALPAETTNEELLGLINELNGRKDINGILCQLPLPRHLDEKAVINAIAPEKDVDAFHPINVGGIMTGDFHFNCSNRGRHLYRVELRTV